MTTPSERYQTIKQLPTILLDYANNTGPVRRGELRRLVYALLRHYPYQHDIDRLAKACPRLLDKGK